MLKPYDKYQPTNLPWLEYVPSHWSFLRNKNIFEEQKKLVGNDFDKYVLLSLTTKGIIIRDISSGKGKFPKDFKSYKVVHKNDMVFCLFDVDETPRTVGLSKFEGMITGAYDVLAIKNNKVNVEYVYYYYLSLDNIKALKPLYTGLRKVIGLPTFMNTKLPIPPRPEQDQIVRFLNWKSTEINRFIVEKKIEIKRLQELKKAIINKAVTNGLNNAIKMKETGIEWVPQIPAHWKTCYLRQFLFVVSEKNHPNMPLLSVTRENGVILRDVDNYESNHNYIPDDLSGYKLVRKGQFVINKMKAWQGSYGVSEFDGIVSPAYFVFDLKFDNKDFFHFAIRSQTYINFFAQFSDGIRNGQWDLSLQKMKHIPFFVPPCEEQAEILKVVPAQIDEINTLIMALKEEISYVSELYFKTIFDVVTGKVDVRNIVIPEYEEIKEVEIDEDIEDDIEDSIDEDSEE